MRTLKQDNDLFFINTSAYEQLKDEMKTTVVCPKDEFRGHAIYKNFHVSNCHRTWQIEDYDYVIVARPGWYESLSRDKKEIIYNEQKRTGSRMMLANVLITQKYWDALPLEYKKKVIHMFDEYIEPINLSKIPETFKQLHNKFPEKHGGNCFAATLYGVTGEKRLLTEWIHDQTFIEMLKRNDYEPVNKKKGEGVLVFEKDGMVIHACYMIDDNYCFNKSGQTFFNPWHIATHDKLLQDWKGCTVTRYVPGIKDNQTS